MIPSPGPYCDTKSGTILRGRYLSKDEKHQIVKPEEVIDGLLQSIFRIKNVLDAVISVVALATILAIILVFALSLRLRQREIKTIFKLGCRRATREIKTIFKLGCRRATIARLLTAEILIIVVISGVLCGALIFLTNSFANDLVRMLFIR
jgi:putative ABC transport system permease protein